MGRYFNSCKWKESFILFSSLWYQRFLFVKFSMPPSVYLKKYQILRKYPQSCTGLQVHVVTQLHIHTKTVLCSTSHWVKFAIIFMISQLNINTNDIFLPEENIDFFLLQDSYIDIKES